MDIIITKMIDLTDFSVKAQIAFSLMLIAFSVFWYVFVRDPEKKRIKSKS